MDNDHDCLSHDLATAWYHVALWPLDWTRQTEAVHQVSE